MDLIAVTNAPSVCHVGGVPFFVGRLTPRAYGLLQKGCGHTLDQPEAIQWLYSDAGRALLIWAALYRHNQVSLTEAYGLERSIDPEEFDILFRTFFAQTGERAQPETEKPEGLPRRRLEWGLIIDELCRDRPGWTYDDVIDLSYDQIINARHNGKPPEPGERELSFAEVQAMFGNADPAPEEPRPAEPEEDPLVLDAIRRFEDAKNAHAQAPDSGPGGPADPARDA